MKVTKWEIDGSPEEIAAYERLMGVEGAGDRLPQTSAQPPPARTASGLDGDSLPPEIRQYVIGRGRSAEMTQRGFLFLEGALEMGTSLEPGRSVRTRDGLQDYLMIRDARPSPFGAAAYLRPGNGRLDLRLRIEDLGDLINDRHVQEHLIDSQPEYQVICWLSDDEGVAISLELLKRALTKIRREG